MRYLLVAAFFAFALFPTTFASHVSWAISPGDSSGQSDFPMILDLTISEFFYPPNIDPQIEVLNTHRSISSNLFVGLTDVNPFTGEITPALAASWNANDDATLWTFHLRGDINWVRYEANNETVEVVRPVTAEDVVYSFKRACDPRLERPTGYENEPFINIIQGCQEIFDDANGDDSLVHGDTIGVLAPDDATVQIQLTEPAVYFPSVAILPLLRTVYREAIEEHGNSWTDVDNIVTNGPYAFAAANDQRWAFVRNTKYPDTLWHGGNIDRVYFSVVGSGWDFRLFEDALVDVSHVPDSSMVIVEPPDHAVLTYLDEDVTFYFAFNHDVPPFDNVHVRRAFSAIIDRDAFVEQLIQGEGVPNNRFLPALFQNESTGDFPVGFDPEYAREQLALAGYPDCEGLPPINIYTYEFAQNWAEFWVHEAIEYLGCSADLFEIQGVDFSTLFDVTNYDADPDERPNAWTTGWSEDYPDLQSWYIDSQLIACGPQNDLHRECSAVDELISELIWTISGEERLILSQQIEERLFGPDGEFPIAPLYTRRRYFYVASWYMGPFETDGRFGGIHWDAYSIDMEAKLAARGEAEQ